MNGLYLVGGRRADGLDEVDGLEIQEVELRDLVIGYGMKRRNHFKGKIQVYSLRYLVEGIIIHQKSEYHEQEEVW